MRIFLDDERDPSFIKELNYDLEIVRDYFCFKDLLDLCVETKTKIQFVSFDHDLGQWETGYDCTKLLVEYDIDHHILSDDFEWNIHSMNPVGAQNIRAYLKNYLEKRQK